MAGLRGIRRRTALWALGAAGFVLGMVLLALDGPMWDAGGPGIGGFEFAGLDGRSDEVLVEWGDSGQDAAELALWLDYLYLLVYGAFWALASAAIRDSSRLRGWRRFERFGRTAPALAIAAATCDAIENTALLVTLGGDGHGAAPVVAAVFATVKFALLALVIWYVIIGLGRLAHTRWRTATRVGLASAGALVAFLLAVNTWVLERETRPASADGGRIVSLPGGDLHVREDGDPRDPPLLLVHGFGSSLHWWDEVVPALIRDHRVIRVDLLGHGGSAAPRSGYSMEEQADRLAQVLDRLGIERTAVVGHSMGGSVVTALAERYTGRIDRVMTIGTPPDPQGGVLSERFAFWPVTGHAIRRLLPADLKQARLEAAFSPEYEVPRRYVDDVFERTTFVSFRESGQAYGRFGRAGPLDERLARTGRPTTVVYGRRDDSFDEGHVQRWRRVAGARVILIDGIGHSPQLEAPERTAQVILDFAR